MISDFSLNGKVALVTGASRGIGKSVAIGLAHAGADLVLLARSKEGLDETARTIKDIGRNVIVLPTDMSEANSIISAIDQAYQKFGKIDCLINNAGTAILQNFLDGEISEWEKLFKVNITGTLTITKLFGAKMIESANGGSIINIGSIYGLVGAPGNAIYSLSKGGIMALTRTLSIEWARYKIRVNSICPGWIRTELTNEHINNPKVAEAALRLIPLRRFGEPEDITPLAIYLASKASSYVTGQCIVVDGGQTVR